MKRKILIYIFTVLFIISLILSMYYILIHEISIFMCTFVLCTIFFITTVGIISTNKDNIEEFDSTVNRILSFHKSKLIEKANYPDLMDKNIIMVESIDDLLNISKEFNKKIYYVKTNYTCSFILIVEDDSYIYIIKKDEEDISALEIIIKDIEVIKKRDKKI